MAETKQKGKIVRVAGPLAVAVGLSEAKMYEVVKVGSEHLIGEIIRIEGDHAFIQVYEETAGLGPGEPVLLTGESLAVELGPGLVANIYDGIQRPLKDLAEKSGNFISRGLEARALDPARKWNFKPLKKEGETVRAGDIIGEVPETPLVNHKVMIPPSVSAVELISIVKAGEYSLDQSIAKVKTSQGIEDIFLSHRWPIRTPRPINKKLIPQKALITGQRVIDTLFPIAKGGSGCVPGPFGSGKCVSGDTEVLTEEGRLISIRNIFESYKGKGKRTIKEGEDYTVLDSPFRVFCYKDGKIVKEKVNAVYKGRTQRMIEIETKTGRKIKVTPIHKLFTLGDNLELREKEAQTYKQGDFIVMPRVLPFPEKDFRFDPYEIFADFRVSDKKALVKISKDIVSSAVKLGSLKMLSKRLGLGYTVLIEYKSGRNKPTLNFVKQLYALRKEEPLKIFQIKGERESKSTKVPAFLSKDVAEFLGLMFSEGSFKGSTSHFYNNCEKTQERFAILCQKIFGLKVKREMANTVQCSTVFSVVLARFLKYVGFPEYQKSLNLSMPSFMFSAKKEVVGRFLGSYFVGDGSCSKESGTVELATSSSKLATGISYLLHRIGIIHSLSSRKTKVNLAYRINIYGYDNIKMFYENAKLPYPKFKSLKNSLKLLSMNLGSRYDIVPIKPSIFRSILAQREKFYSILKANGVEISNYISRGENLTRKMFQRIVSSLELKSLEKFAFNHLSHIFFDKVKTIRVLNKEEEVYDLEVEKAHNFIGGNAPCFFHNTVVQHQFAKWSDADVIIFVGCGERGNEMTDLLLEFPELKDPKTGRPLMERTVLVANTSNMPVAAREASVYTGITIAEYFRDMGYSVAILADSTSRWAEALREISGRLEEMPGDEGYPAYLGSRTAAFYERAGAVECLGSQQRTGFLTVVGAVSPPGGDLSEPVTQNTLRVTKVFWALDSGLAYKRHFPAINWLTSYSLYSVNLKDFFEQEAGEGFGQLQQKTMSILQKEAELMEIVRLVGVEALSQKDQFLLEVAQMIREDFLHQNAFLEVDSYTSLAKQYLMIKAIVDILEAGEKAIQSGKTAKEILNQDLKDKVSKMKLVAENNLEQFQLLFKEISNLG